MLNKYKHILHLKQGYLIAIAIVFFVVSIITLKLNNKKYLPQNVQQVFQQSINNKEKDFEALLTNELFLAECKNETTKNSITSLFNKPYGVFLYQLDSSNHLNLKSWSNNKYHINELDISLSDTNYLVKYENGVFEIVKKIYKANSQTFLLVGMIPIKWDYFIKNKYLNADFDKFNWLDKCYEISDSKTNIAIKNVTGKVLLFLKKNQIGFFFQYDWVTILFRFTAIILLLIAINSWCKKLSQIIGFNRAFYVLTFSIIIIRIATYLFRYFPFDFSKLSLFDPSIYAASYLHPSLGDLLINLCLVFWLLSFYNKHRNKNALTATSTIKQTLPFIHLALMVVLSFMLTSLVKSLVVDSKISFDVSNFFSLTIYSVVALIAVCLIFINYYKCSLLLLKEVVTQNIPLFIQSVVIIGFSLFILLFKYLVSNSIPFFDIATIFWLLFFVWLIQKINNTTILSLTSRFSISLFWIIFFSASASALIVSYNKTLEIEQRKKIAEKIYFQNDAIAENLLSIATTGFSDAFFQNNFLRFYKSNVSNFIRDSLAAENFSGYLNKYQTSIYLFDKNCKPINNIDSATVDKWNNSITTSGKSIGLDGLFSIKATAIGESYIYKKILLDKNKELLCQLFILIHPKKNKSIGLFPELFKQGEDAALQSIYSYALYDSGKLVEQNGNYHFPQLQNNISETYFINEQNRISILFYQPTVKSMVVVVKNSRTLLDLIALFSYLFFAFLLVVFFFFLIDEFAENSFHIFKLFHQIQFNIRNQIRATIIFISFFSFIIIGIVTILFFVNKINAASEQRLIKSINYAATEIENAIAKKDSSSNPSLEKLLIKISEQQELDINIFDSSGVVKATTQPYIYNRKLVDSRMNPLAYEKIYSCEEILFHQEEEIGNLSFISLYKSVVDDNGKVLACINIPYLNSQAELNQEISGFIATLMTLNAFIFLIAGAIAYLITNKITASFKLIKNKMKAINWQSHNEEISWNRNDEIGALVNEYNIMVRKLDETAKAFALSQREQAWKEMAKQVAHEIKNPLTPMKLGIQYLKKSIDDNSPNVKAISETVATTLIEQINQLATIAGDFSQFANIGNDKPEQIDLNDVLLSIINLYATDERVNIQHEFLSNKNIVFANKMQLMRVFTNLLKNAIEASSKTTKINIYIKQVQIENKILVSIMDEGEGIADEMQAKIFTLNFTTKSSGTGLGLAICKGIVENVNGKIWFETSENGPTFFVELPLTNI